MNSRNCVNTNRVTVNWHLFIHLNHQHHDFLMGKFLLGCVKFRFLWWHPIYFIKLWLYFFVLRLKLSTGRSFADSCASIEKPCSSFSPDSGTQFLPPEVNSTSLTAHLPNIQIRPLMDMDFAISCPLIRSRLLNIRFLFVSSRLFPTPTSNPDSWQRLCTPLALHLHQVVQRTCTLSC